MADTAPKQEGGKGDRKEGGRGRGGRGGRGRGEGRGEGRGRGEGGKGRGEGGKGRPRKPRAEIPTYDDPEAELTKLQEQPEPPKANREVLDTKIGRIQNEIEANKKRTEAITKELDRIKAENERLKESGSGAIDKCRDALRDLKKQIVGVIEERKQISATIDNIREKKKTMDDAIQKQKAAVGRFTSNESIDEEIRRIEDYMAHNTIGIKQEKEYMQQIKELNKKRDEVKALEVMEGRRGTSGSGGKAMSLPELFEARKKVDGRLDELRAFEKTAQDAFNVQREKTQSKDSGKFETLLGERKEIRDKISEKIGSIRELRAAFQEEDDKWFEYDRLVKNLKWQIRQKKNKEYEANKEQYEAEKKKKQEDWEKEKEHRKNFDEDGNPREKFMDFELAERIGNIEQLIVFLQKYQPQEEAAAEVAAVADGRTVEKPTDVNVYSRGKGTLDDDPLGINAFAVDEVVSKKNKKRDKKKKNNAAKTDVATMIADGETVTLDLSLDMIQQFASMQLAVPTSSDDCAGSIAQLQEKKEYYTTKGDPNGEAMSLKDILKAERDAKTKAKGGGEKKEKKEKKKEEKEEAVEEKAEAPPAKADAAEEKKGPDWHAEKIARKLADAPEVDADLVAQLRAKAQSGGMTDEQKKERGLLYDTSKASAVRDDEEEEDDEGAADFEGGDPFAGLDDY